MADFDTVIRGGQIVTPDAVIEADLAMRDGEIAAIGPDLSQGADEVDASGHCVLPGGVDPHCHIEQLSGMGVMNADTFDTATRSAALGGTTTVISFAAQQKGARLADTVADYAKRAKRGAHVDYAFHLSLSDIDVPDFAADLSALIDEGHRSIKVFTTYNIALDDRAILQVLAQARAHGALVCVHAENDGLIAWTRDALLAAGHTNPIYHAVSHPRLAEVEAVSRLCVFAEYFATPVMLFHISTAEALDVIRRARARGVPVWAETCPHYLLMSGDVLDRPGLDGAKWMCSPPQRDASDQAALWTAVSEGLIPIVSSDHAPYRYDASGKLSAGSDATFAQIANGLPGLETRMPLMFDAMVSKGKADLCAFADRTAGAAARIYGLARKGRLVAGLDADVVLWNPQASRTYGPDDLHDNVGYNPWQGHGISGLPTDVWSRGDRIVTAGELTSTPGRGHWQRRDSIGVKSEIPPAAEVQMLEGASS